jgi:hypothetical protein
MLSLLSCCVAVAVVLLCCCDVLLRANCFLKNTSCGLTKVSYPLNLRKKAPQHTLNTDTKHVFAPPDFHPSPHARLCLSVQVVVSLNSVAPTL